jgi:hypothetical protein
VAFQGAVAAALGTYGFVVIGVMLVLHVYVALEFIFHDMTTVVEPTQNGLSLVKKGKRIDLDREKVTAMYLFEPHGGRGAFPLVLPWQRFHFVGLLLEDGRSIALTSFHGSTLVDRVESAMGRKVERESVLIPSLMHWLR